MKYPKFTLPNSLTILKKYKKQGNNVKLQGDNPELNQLEGNNPLSALGGQ